MGGTTSRETPHTAVLPSRSYALHPIVEKIFQSRGLDQFQIDQFFSLNLQELPPLFDSLLDSGKAAQRILQAIHQGESIGIYGDYDVDGSTSCALFYHFFKIQEVFVRLYQPSRFTEGYGLHLSSIDRALEDQVSLLITVDCGITSGEASAYAQKKGLDLIITDHHQDAAPEMPPAFAVINPNRRDETCDPQLRTLAGVGVAFALCLRVRELLIKSGQNCPSLYPLLPFVALGTICDMVELGPLNLKLVRHGLRALKHTHYEGLKQLFSHQERKKNIIASEYLSFQVGPLINSKGRLDHPQKALELLTTDDPNSAFELLNHLKICNKKRRSIQAQIFEQAKEQVLSQMYGQEILINIVYAPDWHEGVIGIVASKLVETFKVPAIVFCQSQEKEILKGSARSAGHFNIHEGLSQCSDLFIKFGGHRAAAGLSIPKENLEPLKARLQHLMSAIPAIERREQDHFDLPLSLDDISPELATQLELLEPFGRGNPRPIFEMEDALLDSFQILKDVHVRWTFRSSRRPKTFQGISFFFIGRWGALSPQELMAKENLTVQFSLGFNEFRGNKFIQLQVVNLF